MSFLSVTYIFLTLDAIVIFSSVTLHGGSILNCTKVLKWRLHNPGVAWMQIRRGYKSKIIKLLTTLLGQQLGMKVFFFCFVLGEKIYLKKFQFFKAQTYAYLLQISLLKLNILTISIG